LTVGRDKETALNLLTIANHHLTLIQNTIFTPLKEALHADIHALKTTPTPNLIHIYSQLSQITKDVNQLNPFPTQVQQTINDTVANMKKAAKNESHWYNRIWNSLKEIKHLFVIHEIQTTSAPVTAPDKIFYIKQNIEIKLSTAQWALLHNNNEIYQSSLKTVSNWITQYFSMSGAAEPIIKQVNLLSQQNISNHLPNLENTINTLNKIKIQPPIIHQQIESTNTTKNTEDKSNTVKPHVVKPIESTKSVEI